MYNVTEKELKELVKILYKTRFDKFEDGLPFMLWIKNIEQAQKE